MTITFIISFALNRGKRGQSYILQQASNPARSLWSLTICHTLLENRSFYLHDKPWILDSPPGPPPERALSVLWMFLQQRWREQALALSTPDSNYSACTVGSWGGFSLWALFLLCKLDVYKSVLLWSWTKRQVVSCKRVWVPRYLGPKPAPPTYWLFNHGQYFLCASFLSSLQWEYLRCFHYGFAWPLNG